MTLKKSSVNPFCFTFLRTCLKNWLLPLVIFLLTGYTFFVCGFVDAKKTYDINLFDGYGESYLESHKFQLSDNNWGGLGFFIDFLLIAAAVVLGISIFRYMFSKKSVNVYFSLGMTRAGMFLSKYIAGVFLLTVSCVIPMLADVIGNITIFGSSKELWISAAYMTVCVVQMLLYAYSITVFVCCCVGTLLEAGFFSVVFIAMPMIAEYLVKVLFGTVLYGSPYAGFNYSTEVYGMGNYRQSYTFSAAQNNILFFNSGRFNKYHELSRGLETEGFKFENPDMLPVIIMLAVIAIVSLAAYMFYKKRKTEIAGFIGSNPVITSIGIFVISSFLFSFLSEHFVSLDFSNKYLAFLLAFGSIFIVYTVVELVSLRSIKLFFKKFWKITVHYAIMGAVIAAFVTGLFGYSTRIPDKSEIEKIAVSSGTGDEFYNNGGSYSNWNMFIDSYYPGITADAGLRGDSTGMTLIDGYDSPDEIEHILEIHSMLIEMQDGDLSSESLHKSHGERTVSSATRIIYTLKDGSKFDRLYSFSNDEINAMLSQLVKTENYKTGAADALAWYFGLNEVTYEPEETFTDYESSMVYVPDSQIVISLASPNFSSFASAPALNTDEAFKELYNALKSDILSDRLPLDYVTDSPVKGYIHISNMEAPPPVIAKKTGYDWYTDNAVIGLSDANIVIPVYESMSAAVAVIEKYGCTSLFENSKEPVLVETWKYDENAFDPYSSRKTTLIQGVYINRNEALLNDNFDLYSSYDENGEKQRMVAPRLAPNSVETSNPVQIEKFSDAFRMISLDCYDGCYVRLIFDDGSCAYGYAPCSLLD